MKNLFKEFIYHLFLATKIDEYEATQQKKYSELKLTTVNQVLTRPDLFANIFENIDKEIRQAWLNEYAKRCLQIFQ